MNSRLTVIVLTLIIALNLSCSAADQVEPIIIDSAPAKAAPSQKPVFIDPLSVRSLYVIMSKGNKKLGMATGFVVEKDGKYYLITNWHVLSGRNPQTNQPFDKSGDTPDRIHVIHHAKKLGTWVVKPEMLYDKKGKIIEVQSLKCQITHSTTTTIGSDKIAASEEKLRLEGIPLKLVYFDVVADKVHIVDVDGRAKYKFTKNQS